MKRVDKKKKFPLLSRNTIHQIIFRSFLRESNLMGTRETMWKSILVEQKANMKKDLMDEIGVLSFIDWAYPYSLALDEEKKIGRGEKR